jgi:hypothetical protein
MAAHQTHLTPPALAGEQTMARIAREAQDAAARGMSINDACPYPFGTAEARHFKAVHLQAMAGNAVGLQQPADHAPMADQRLAAKGVAC